MSEEPNYLNKYLITGVIALSVIVVAINIIVSLF